jgi:hypothetical protein
MVPSRGFDLLDLLDVLLGPPAHLCESATSRGSTNQPAETLRIGTV